MRVSVRAVDFQVLYAASGDFLPGNPPDVAASAVMRAQLSRGAK